MSDIVKLFCDMVRIDSESGEEERFIAYLKGLFEQELGAECSLDSYGNLIAKISGKESKAEPLLLIAHADTVKPGKGIEPVVEDGVIRSQGETVLGADDKAGIVEIFTAIKSAERHPPLEIVVTRSEEIGLLGAKNLDYSLISAKRGFVLDSDKLEVVIIGGPSHFSLDVEITGRAAHAGMEPEKGISAIRAAALAITKIPEGRIDGETTANVGIIRGGEIRNGVPEKALIQAECRSLNHEKAVRQAELMKRAFEEAAREIGAKAEVKLDLEYKASQIPEDAPTVKLAKEAIAAVGLRPEAKVITGGTDASIFNTHGIETAVLGIGVKAEHSKGEHIAIADMEKAVEIIRHLLAALA
ncbi:TPA: M20/M25/M40 family metallo-hydrolase [Candidatus Bipolaricaulota bacterium]|nr:M20/M25/M40 family metallo-hydrolase [Candidatus Bipolaricaulota bacterium]